MVKCKKCGDEDYGVNMVVEDGDFLCPTCATDYIIYQKKKTKKLSKKLSKKLKKKIKFLKSTHDWEECCYDYKQSLLNRIKELRRNLRNCENWIGTVTLELVIPRDASASRALDRIVQISKGSAKDFTN